MEDKSLKKSTIWTRGFCCILISNICANLASFSVNTYITTYMTYLGVGASLTGLIVGLYYSTGLLLRPVSGPMQSMMNKKKLMTATYLLALIVNICYALFPTVVMFTIFRLIHGVQLAFFGSLALTIASASLPEEKMASGLGIYGLSGIVAQTLGPSISVFVKDFGDGYWGDGGGFKAIFLTSAFFSLCSVIPCFFLPNIESVSDKKALGKWYKNIIAKDALPPAIVLGLLTVSSILYTTYMVPYGEYRGISNIGLYFTVNAIVMALSRPIAGKLTDKYGQNKTFYPGIFLYMCSFVIISFAHSIKFIIAGAICASLGAGTIHPAVQSMALQSVKADRRAVASNTVFTIMDLGNFLGPTIAGKILEVTNYESMYRLALIPLSCAVIVFAASWKHYVACKEQLSAK